MQVGIDSYVTIYDADAYVASRYISSDAARLRWDALPDDDKEILLIQACAEIEALQLRGKKMSRDQLLAFPRRPFQDLDVTWAPDEVRHAQIELALWLSDSSAQADAAQRQNLQAQGVTGFSIGDLSESYKTGAGEKPAPLLCPKSQRLLAQYVFGGFVTC